MTKHNKIFWLHIKKSGGTSIRKMLSPVYNEDDRKNYPQCFIMAKKMYWNDILNNFKTPLGHYQFKRMFFAKTFLYSTDEFNNLFKFAFSREPVSRAKSMFFFLFKSDIRQILNQGRANDLPKLFGIFLNYIEEVRNSSSNNSPHGLKFQTHTAEMFSDITDEKGEILTNKIWKLENLDSAIKQILKFTETKQTIKTEYLNKQSIINFNIEDKDINRLHKLFKMDFQIYKSAE